MSKYKIPHGNYCYVPIGWQGCKYKISPCPYWSKDPSKPEQQNGYCSYLGYGDWHEDKGFGLLWDQVKECGINEEP